MKTKKIISALLVGAIAATAAASASAATLTKGTPDGSTEVTAKILGAGPGEVSYIITIPDKVDFGTLEQPTTDTDSYKYVGFRVVATEINNFANNQAVTVYIKDTAANDGKFYLTQKSAETPFTMPYDVYEHSVNDDNRGDYTPMNENSDFGENGYHLCTFATMAEGSAQDVTLALNQRAIYGKELSEIEGDYSGTMVFHSAITTIGG